MPTSFFTQRNPKPDQRKAIKKPQAQFRALRLACGEQTRLPGGRRTTPFNGKDESTHAMHGRYHLCVKHSARLL